MCRGEGVIMTRPFVRVVGAAKTVLGTFRLATELQTRSFRFGTFRPGGAASLSVTAADVSTEVDFS